MKAPVYTDRPDKLYLHLKSEVENYLFAELNPNLLRDGGLEFMAGVPMPMTSSDAVDSANKGIAQAKLADNMAIVIGSDPKFVYTQKYIEYLKKCFDDKLILIYIQKGVNELNAHSYRRAIIYFRAALLLDESSRDAMYCYACGCREWYVSMEGEDDSEDFVKVLKEESNEYFELLTDNYPDFAPAWYYLGYSYVNVGQYLRAKICWKKYLANASDEPKENIDEINERIESLKDPCKIEEGINLVAAGQPREGASILETYVDTDYAKWWPLHMCLATAYTDLGFIEEAIEGYHRVLELAPSNIEANQALADLYSQLGDSENAEKYINKVDLLSNKDS